jgi:hypothetical protein
LVDLNGDGRTDIVSGSWPGQIYWFKRNPNGTYAASETIKRHGTNLHVGSAAAPAVADWDADGDLDLLIGTIDGFVHYLKNEGSKTAPLFKSAEKLHAGGNVIKVVGGDAGPCVADWDGDGKLDLILGAGSGGVQWCRRVDTDKLDAPQTLVPVPAREVPKKSFDNPKAPGTRTKVCVADWNADGKQDLIVGDFWSGGSRNYHGWVWVYLRGAASTAAAGK